MSKKNESLDSLVEYIYQPKTKMDYAKEIAAGVLVAGAAATAGIYVCPTQKQMEDQDNKLNNSIKAGAAMVIMTAGTVIGTQMVVDSLLTTHKKVAKEKKVVKAKAVVKKKAVKKAA